MPKNTPKSQAARTRQKNANASTNAGPSPRLPGSRAQGWLIYAALLVATFAVYFRVQHFEFLNFDDDVYVSKNPQVAQGLTTESISWALHSTEAGYWFPLTRLSYLLDTQLHGVSAERFHLTNLFLHACSALLAFACFRRMTNALWQSAFVAFAFAIHPAHVEAVAWIAERKELLSALFWWLTLWMYLVYAARPRVWSYCAMVGLFCCGLMSQALIVTLPFVLLMLDYWPLKRFGMGPRRIILEKLPLLALAAAGSIITLLSQRAAGAIEGVQHIPVPVRFENAIVSYVIYIGKFLWPSALAVFYPYVQTPAWQWILAVVTVAAITVLCIRWRSRYPYLLVGWLWFLVTLLPVIGLVQAGSQARADRYTYISAVGLSLMAAWGLAEIRNLRRLVAACAVATVFAWCVVTWQTLSPWENSEALFSHALQVTDQNFIAYNNLGDVLRSRGRIEEAVADFENAVRIQPESPDAQDNLGEALTTLGRAGQAIPHLQAAIRLRPESAKLHIDLGSALLSQGLAKDAASEFREALRLQPSSGDAEYRLAGALAAQGRAAEAVPYFEKALPFLQSEVQQHPENADLHFNLGNVYGLMGRPQDAIGEFSAVVRLQPADPSAHFNLGIALSSVSDFEHAAEHFAVTLRLRPDDAAGHLWLARTLARLGRRDDAIAEYREALRLAPALKTAADELHSLERIH